MSTRREVAKKAIHFENPDYIPLMYYGTKSCEKSDILHLPVQVIFGGEDGMTSDWGFVWGKSDVNFNLGIVEKPAVEDWSQLASYKPLDVKKADRFDAALEVMQQYPDRYNIADFQLSGFTIASFIRGFEDFLADVYLERENIEKLLDIVFATEEDLIRECAKKGFDAICLADDWGTQNSLLMAPNIIRELFIPRYKHEFEVAHSLGLDVMMHSCGYIIDIIEDLIGAGLDILNPGQTALNGIEELGKRFAGRICFGCPVGYQTTVVSGTPADIDKEVQDYIKYLSTDKGGFFGMVSSVKGLSELSVPVENQYQVAKSFETYCGRR